MDLPKLEINGKIFAMKRPAAKIWRTWLEFDKQDRKISDPNFIEEYCKMVTLLFEGVTVEDLLDNLPLDEVIKTYNDCTTCLLKMIAGKFDELEKNSQTAEVAANT